MNERERVLPPMNLNGNVKENWRKWRQLFDIYMIASETNTKEEEIQCAVLLHYIGEQCVEIYNTFIFNKEENGKIKVLIKKFEEYFIPKSNETFERYKFFTRSQRNLESIDQYVTQLKFLALSCDFGSLKDSLIRDKIICGIIDNSIREKLLRTTDLSLTKAIEMCRAAELTRDQCRAISTKAEDDGPGNSEVSVVNRAKQATRGFRKENRPNTSSNRHQKSFKINQCSRCGKSHEINKCPAYGKKCFTCNKINHFTKYCRTKNVNMVSLNSNSENNFFVGSLSQKGNQTDMFKKLNFDINIINESNMKLVTYTGTKLNTLGSCFLKCQINNMQYVLEFHIVNERSPPILGINACQELNLIERVMSVEQTIPKNIDSINKILDKYKHCFRGYGVLKIKPITIKINENANPVIHAPRKIPYTMTKELKDELDKLEMIGIVKKITEPTPWVNSLVIVRKSNGNLRLCIDPKDLNKEIKREHYQMPSMEDIMSKLQGAKFFSTLDASNGFWQIPLDKQSSILCTFNTPFGRYRFLRLPFGISCASEVFQRNIKQIIDDIAGTDTYIDDILIWGDSIEQHNDRLEKVLQRLDKYNFKLNKSKSKFCVQELKYLGNIISKDGISPDDEKIKAISEIAKPDDKKSLERFLGMVTYLGRYIKNLSEKTANLRELLKKDVCWHWNNTHDESFEKLQRELMNPPVLKFYNINRPVTVSVDASQNGLGAVLLQDNSPIAYASKSLTITQKRWAQIEKELFAIVFGCERFSQYLIGKKITVETDHKPLVNIFRKKLVDCPLRLQRMLLRLQRFDIDLKFIPGRDLKVADTLSRAYVSDQNNFDEIDKEIEANVFMLVRNINITDKQLLKFQNETNLDTELVIVRKYIQEGWPLNKNQVDEMAKAYYMLQDELTEFTGLIFKNNRIVVPKSLRKEMLNRIHYNHLGIEKCKARARECLYWPGMNNDIQNLVFSCTACTTFKKSQQKEPIKLHSIPGQPWKKIGMDVFYFDNANYLLMIDYYSKYVEISRLSNLTSQELINQCKRIFARHGIPDCVMSDNGTNFSSIEFSNFAKEWDFKNITSSPRYPQSNGMVERHIQTMKSMLKKGKYCKQDLYLVLLEYRNTPIDGKYSPAELLMGRKLRGILPISKNNKINHSLYKRNLKLRQDNCKYYYNRNCRRLKPIRTGQNVYVQLGNQWNKGKVLNNCGRPRSYNIETENGKIFERNRKFIKLNTVKPLADTEYKPTRLKENDVINENDVTDCTNSKDLECASSKHFETRTKSGRVIKPPDRLKY